MERPSGYNGRGARGRGLRDQGARGGTGAPYTTEYSSGVYKPSGHSKTLIKQLKAIYNTHWRLTAYGSLSYQDKEGYRISNDCVGIAMAITDGFLQQCPSEEVPEIFFLTVQVGNRHGAAFVRLEDRWGAVVDSSAR